MAGREPGHYGAGDTIVQDNYGPEPEPDAPIPGWRKPIALVGWGVLIAILLGLIIWGIGQLVDGAAPQEPATTIAPTITSKTSKTPTTPRSSAAPVAPPTHHSDEQTTTATTPGTDAPSASTENSGVPTTTSTPSPGAFRLPQLPSVITLPSLPGLPTEITLPPGL
jgi:hypothetical protein